MKNINDSLNVNPLMIMMVLAGVGGGTAGVNSMFSAGSDDALQNVAQQLQQQNDRLLVIETRLKIEGERDEKNNCTSASD